MDLSGLESIVTMCDGVKSELPKMNAEYLRQEWYRFLDFVLPMVLEEAYDTGHMANRFEMSDVRQKDGLTEADWENLAEYASFNNYGFTHHISGEKIPGVFWWERAFSSLGKESASRYSEMLKNLIESKLTA